MSAPVPASRSATGGHAARVAALVALGLWGLTHLLGGLSLVVSTGRYGPARALEDLATDAPASEVPADPGEVVAGLLRFHGLDVAAAGLVVLLLTVLVSRVRWPLGVSTSLVVVLVLDAGLVATFLVPGLLGAEGLLGPMLGLVALVGAWSAGWRPRQP